MSVQAVYKGVRMSPRKVSVVAALVRGRSVADAMVILDHTPRRAAQAVKKAVVSAGANAEHNHNYKPDTLFISEISVTPGIRYRRYRAAARGQALRFARSTSQIWVLVDGQQRENKKKSAKAVDQEKSDG